MNEIKVSVASYGEGRNLAMTYIDPVTGKKVARTSGTTDRREAERAAAVWEDELNTGRYQAPSKLTWADFRKRYETDKLSALAPATLTASNVALDHLERVVNPDRMVKLTPAVMGRFQSKLRAGGMRETTIARHLRHVKAALRWAESQGLITKAPKIDMPHRQRGQTMMRGRPITAEEFDRMIDAVSRVRPDDAPVWRRLWLSGLRLGEAMALSWGLDAPLYADLTGRRPAFRIYAEAQKARRDEILPMTPDFYELLAATPEADRTGKVFKVVALRTGKPLLRQEVGRVVSAIGRKANVMVNKADGKYASAHDLRRAFGTRWAKRVMPAVLQRLMRHSEISTTMRYYVSHSADEMSDELWGGYWGEATNPPAASNTCGNIEQEKQVEKGRNDCRKSLCDNG